MILLAFALVVVAPVAFRLASELHRRHQIATELRRDWWPAFEREFRAYASRAWSAARDAEQSG